MGFSLFDQPNCNGQPAVFLHIDREFRDWILQETDKDWHSLGLKLPANIDKCDVWC